MGLLAGMALAHSQKAKVASATEMAFMPAYAATGYVMSIGDLLQHKKPIRTKKLINKVFAKIEAAVIRTNRRQDSPDPAKLELDEEEVGVLDLILKGVKYGITEVITMTCEALFSFASFAISAVVVPMFTVASAAILAALPLLVSPAGLIAVTALGAAFLAYKKWGGSDRERAEKEASAAAQNELARQKMYESSPDLLQRIGKEHVGDVYKKGTDEAATPLVKKELPKFVQPQAVLEEGKSPLPLGIRNNNPGNLEYHGQPGALPKTQRFAVFESQGAGLYNLGRQLELYVSRGSNTVDKIIHTFAPPNENKTASYIADVAARMGVKADDVLNLADKQTLAALMSAVIWHENGMNPYTKAQIDEAADRATQFAKNGYQDVGRISLAIPASGILTSPYGQRVAPKSGATTFHHGIDIANKTGTPIFSAADGTVVTEQSNHPDYGNMLQVQHDGFTTRYAHLSKFSVPLKAAVKRGQQIGEMGSTGVSTGPHLHFEVSMSTAKDPIDPAQFLPGVPKQYARIAPTEPMKGGPMGDGKKPAEFVRNSSGMLVAIKE